jgi:hypothetical protein
LKEDISFDGLTNIMKENGLKIYGDELYNEYTMKSSLRAHVSTDQKRVQYYSKVSAPNLLKIVVCFVYSCSAIVECVFSIMKNLWTDDQNRLQIKTVESELAVRLNFKMMCVEFH